MNTPAKLFLIFVLLPFLTVNAQNNNALEGRWNLTITQEGKQLPSWLEITHSGYHTLVGRFVYEFGSARPISEIKCSGNTFAFSIPRQWEPEGNDMEFEGTLDDNGLRGTMVYTDGKMYNWTAVRAPKLTYTATPQWGRTELLFNGKNLEGWTAMGKNQWEVISGVLKSPRPGANLVSQKKFTNFKLHVEFRYPKDSNSGVYLRGRYEVQIADNKGLEPTSIYFGGIYGFLTPNEMVAKKAGEWQTYDITLVGRRVTVVANGKPIIIEQNIPGMTGGALDNDEASAGPIMIQGDHGPIEFRAIEITPMVH